MEDKGVWQEWFTILAFMADKNKEAHLTSLCNLLYEVAGNHANFRDLGFEAMKRRGLHWVLNRLKLEVIRLPQWRERIKITTWVSEMKPFSHRHFLVEDEAGNVLASGYSIWIPIESATRKPKRFDDYDVPLIPKLAPCGPTEKLTGHVETSLSYIYKVAYSDVDMIGHVNNAKYVEWVMNDFMVRHVVPPRVFSIQYLAEVFLGEEICIRYKEEAESLYYVLTDVEEGREVCRAKVYF